MAVMKPSLPLAALALASCTFPKPQPYVPVEGERIEMWHGGTLGAGTTLSVNREGNGRFQVFGGERTTVGTFKLKPGEFEHLSKLLEKYRKEAMPAQSLPSYGSPWCPKGHRVYDAGAVHIAWVGPNYDVRYEADFGCDPEKHAARNAEVWDIFEWLSKPLQPQLKRKR